MYNPRFILDGVILVIVGSQLSWVATAGFNKNTEAIWYPMYQACYNASLCLFAMNVHYGLFREGWREFRFWFWATLFTVLTFGVAYLSYYAREQRLGAPVLPIITTVIKSVTFVSGPFYFTLYVYCRERGWPSFSRYDRPFWSLVMPVLLTIPMVAASVDISVYAFQSFAFLMTLYVIVAVAVLAFVFPVGYNTELPALVLVQMIATYTPQMCMTLANVVDAIFSGQNQLVRDIAILTFTILITTLAIQLLIELLPFFVVEAQDRALLPFFSVQFTQSYTIGAIFLESTFDWRFAILLFIVALFAILKDSGTFNEIYFRIVYRKASKSRLWLYMGTRYQLMQQKVMGEFFSAPLLMSIIAVEYKGAQPLGMSRVVTDSVPDDGFHMLCTAYATIFGIEVICGMIASSWFDIKMERFTAAFKMEASINSSFDIENKTSQQSETSTLMSDERRNRSRSQSSRSNRGRARDVEEDSTSASGVMSSSEPGKMSGTPTNRESKDSSHREQSRSTNPSVSISSDTKVSYLEKDSKFAGRVFAPQSKAARRAILKRTRARKETEQAYARSHILSSSYLSHANHDKIGFVLGALISMWAFYSWKNPRNKL